MPEEQDTGNEPKLVKHESQDTLGIYWPEQHVIEFYIDDEREEMHGDCLGDIWLETNQLNAAKSVQKDIDRIRDEIDSIKDEQLTEDQKRELRNMGYELDAKENTLQVIRELHENEE